MTDDQIADGQAVPATESEAPAIPAKDEPENLQAPETSDEEQVTETDDELDEIEIEGEKYSIPKKLKKNFMLEADYTRKRQEDATYRKQLESREAEINQMREASDEELRDRAVLIDTEGRIKEYEKLSPTDWEHLRVTDPLGWQHHRDIFRDLKDHVRDLRAGLDQKQTERTQKAQQVTAKRLEETEAFAKTIKGWTPDMHNKIVQNVLDAGIDMPTLRTVLTPALYKLMHQAHVGRLTIEQQTVPKPASPKPLNQITAKASKVSSRDLGSASMDDYIAARRKGVGGKPAF